MLMPSLCLVKVGGEGLLHSNSPTMPLFGPPSCLMMRYFTKGLGGMPISAAPAGASASGVGAFDAQDFAVERSSRSISETKQRRANYCSDRSHGNPCKKINDDSLARLFVICHDEAMTQSSYDLKAQ